LNLASEKQQHNGVATRVVYRDALDATRKIVANHGITGLYRGLIATCCRQGPGLGIYFASYGASRYLETNGWPVFSPVEQQERYLGEWYDDEPRSLLIGSVSIDGLCHFLQGALYNAKGQLGANLILGGVWKEKAYLRAIHPHGSMDVDLPFCALGSGGLAAMGVLEKGYRNDLSVEEGIAPLVQRAIVAGIQNDLGSGSQVDLCVIAPDGTSQLQRCVVPEEELEEGFRAAEVKEEANKVVEGDNNLGVNGFGNLPFAVQSKKVLLVSAEIAEEERLSKWNDLLGLKEADKGR
jgi:hypothetical protein